MANPADRPKVPKDVNMIPEELATIEQLRAAGLKPGTLRPVSLYKHEEGDRRGLCDLFERSAAVPLPNPSETT